MDIFTLNLFNTGGRGAARHVGMETSTWPELPRAPYDRARLVVRAAGKVFAAADILQTLNMSTWEQPALVLTGTGRKLWEITPAQLASALDSATRSDRSDHERMVSERNFAAIAWLESLISTGAQA